MAADANRRVATVIWMALVSGVVVLLGVALFLAPISGGPPPEVAGILLPVAAALSVVTTAISWLWAVRMPLPAPEGAGPPPPGDVGRTRLVIAAALCEGSALAALVFFLVSGDGRLLLPFAISFVGLLAHFPGARHWARLCGTGGRAGPRPSRMIRE